jgi:Protein of unknown function (DUF1161)
MNLHKNCWELVAGRRSERATIGGAAQMVQLSILIGCVLALGSGAAMAAKPCEELKDEIATKLDAKGVKDYSLEVVATDQVGDQKVVGSCEGGTRKIIYKRS